MDKESLVSERSEFPPFPFLTRTPKKASGSVVAFSLLSLAKQRSEWPPGHPGLRTMSKNMLAFSVQLKTLDSQLSRE